LAEIEVDGTQWYEGQASLVLFGNVGEAFAGVKAFDDASPDDGLLEIGVGSAKGIAQWGRTLARSALSTAIKSPFVHVTKGRSVDVRLDRKVLYELDGGDRERKRRFRVEVQPGAVTVCVPAAKG
jgi:diacylglycerol kinase family enzyme